MAHSSWWCQLQLHHAAGVWHACLTNSPLYDLRAPSPEPNNPSGDCPFAPAINCTSPPHCAGAGVVMTLAGSCVTDAGFSVSYLVNGSLVTSVTCPAAGSAVQVSVRPSLDTKPTCDYNATLGFNVSSECPSGRRAARWGVSLWSTSALRLVLLLALDQTHAVPF